MKWATARCLFIPDRRERLLAALDLRHEMCSWTLWGHVIIDPGVSSCQMCAVLPTGAIAVRGRTVDRDASPGRLREGRCCTDIARKALELSDEVAVVCCRARRSAIR
ncbi:MAG: hypothetical protein ACLT98_13135 [Eggerthellaceae bacterium]